KERDNHRPTSSLAALEAGISFFQYKNSKVRRFWLSLLARSERLCAEKQKKLSGKAAKGTKA
ncbi:hypothetical protein, partial [Bacteroides heparinolyticus]